MLLTILATARVLGKVIHVKECRATPPAKNPVFSALKKIHA
jgi:hypothetical protein